MNEDAMLADDQRLDDEVRRGARAQELLDNEVFQDIWTNFDQQIIRELKASSPRDAEGREKCILMLQLLAKLRAMVEETAQTGRMARLALDRKRSFGQKAREWIGRDGLIGPMR